MMVRVFVCMVMLLPGCDLVTTTVDAEPRDQPGFDAPPRFAGLLREPRPILQIGLVRSGLRGRLVQESVDGAFVRYLSIDRAAIILEHGMLHSLFGFGEGLMGADLVQSLALARRGQSGRAIRRHTYLTAGDRTLIRTFECDISDRGSDFVELPGGPVVTRLMYETCRDETGETIFENQYWVDLLAGEVLQSLQWVGEDFGAISTRVIPVH